MWVNKNIVVMVCVGFFITLAACSSELYGVRSDYDQSVDFTKYKSFSWWSQNKEPEENSLVRHRVESAVENELKAKGFAMTSDGPDFFIVEHHSKKGKVSIHDFGYGYAQGGYRGYSRGYGGVSTYEYEEGSLIIDFVDAETKKMFWRGSVKAEVQYVDSPEKSTSLIKSAVKEILDHYPPPPSSK